MRILVAIIVAVALNSFTVLNECTAQEISYSNAQLTLIDNVKVASSDPGVVELICVKPGEKVSEGDVLVELDSALFAREADASKLTLEIAQQEAENDVDIRFAEKSSAVSQKQLLKSENAVREFALSISETEIDRLKLERDQALLSKEQAELEHVTSELTVKLRDEQRKIAAIQLDRRVIRAPLDGEIVEVGIQRGEAVASGQTIVRIVSLTQLRVKAVYDSEFALQVKVGQKAEFLFEGNDGPVSTEAKVVFVSPEVRASEQVFEVWADVDNSDGELLPGFKGKLTIIID